MSGDWIKMRASLCTHPKVLLIAEIIAESTEIGRRLTTGFQGPLCEVVTRDVTRDVTLAALLRVWCATNEHTEDGVWQKSSLKTIDQAAGISGFGEAMEVAGWAIYDADAMTVTLPNFLENNAPAKNNARSSGAERQARYRAKKAANVVTSDAKSDVTRDVTLSVTSDAREEKRREDKDNPPTPRKRGIAFDPEKAELPNFINRELWLDWCRDRKARKHPITEIGCRQQLRDLSAWHEMGLDANSAIRKSIASGWQSLRQPDAPRANGPAAFSAPEKILMEFT